MATEDTYRVWAGDAEVLAQVGRSLYEQQTRVQVRLPRQVADAALAAWQRDDDEGALPPETPETRATRHRAGSLALIGLAIESGGVVDGDDVVVEIESWSIGLALEAADEAGLLVGLKTPPR